jgi:hypothetical protein
MPRPRGSPFGAASTEQVSIRSTPLLTSDELDKALLRAIEYRARRALSRCKNNPELTLANRAPR